MANYTGDFNLDFIRRTREILKEYGKLGGKYDATLLVNCLVGLLIVPHEKFASIPVDPTKTHLAEWGILANSVKSYGTWRRKKKRNGTYSKVPYSPRSIRGFLESLRNAVSHFRVTPMKEGKTVGRFCFEDRNGFRAQLALNEIEAFTNYLAAHLERERQQIINSGTAKVGITK